VTSPAIKIKVPEKIRSTLDKLAGSFDNIPAVQGMIGTIVTALITKAMSWESTSIGAGYHGIDAIMKDTWLDRFAVVEAKGGPGSSLKGEMTNAWIASRLKKIRDENTSGTDASAFDNAVRLGTPTSALVVKVDISSKNNSYIAAKMQTYPNIHSQWGSPF
jgi:hypothetical protein